MSDKVITTIYISPDLIRRAKKRNINISAFVEQKLIDELKAILVCVCGCSAARHVWKDKWFWVCGACGKDLRKN